jgi:hypothetical protein
LRALAEKRTLPARRYALSIACGVAAFVGIAIQLKFYRYHWVALVPALVLTAGELILDVAERMSPGVARLAGLGLIAAYSLCGEPSRWWWAARADLLAVLSGVPRERVVARLVIPALFYDRGESGRVAEWLSEHTAESDLVLVRGFLPEIYALARRRAAARFFWTIPLTDRSRSFRVDEWRAHDRNELERSSPSYVVALGTVHDGIDSAEYFYGVGYVPEVAIGRLVILRRAVAGEALVSP